jgi:hypothetical protein
MTFPIHFEKQRSLAAKACQESISRQRIASRFSYQMFLSDPKHLPYDDPIGCASRNPGG